MFASKLREALLCLLVLDDVMLTTCNVFIPTFHQMLCGDLLLRVLLHQCQPIGN